MDELDDLYFGNKMSEVADAVRTFPIIYDITQRQLYRKVLDDLKNGTVNEIDTDLYEAYGNGLRKAVDTVLGESEYGDEYFDMQMQMQANVSRFAAYKAYHATQELKDVDPADIDRKGKLILNKYNRWQAAEYNTAVARARTAKQYHDFTSDPISNELYPNIKWLPSRSASPREAHRVFWNRVWAKNDPFWNSNTPGSLWNCKCDWEETDEPVTNGNPNGTMSSKGLDGNPAVTGKVFTDDCPYVKKGGKIVADFWEPIEQHHNEYLKYLKDADYHDVDFNWNGGMKAIHNGHIVHSAKKEEKFFKEQLTSTQLEQECQDVLFRLGHKAILRDESQKDADGKVLPSLDMELDDKIMDIRSITTGRCGYALLKKNKQLGNVKFKSETESDSVCLYFHESTTFSKEMLLKDIKWYKETLQSNGAKQRIKNVYIVTKDAEEILIYEI